VLDRVRAADFVSFRREETGSHDIACAVDADAGRQVRPEPAVDAHRPRLRADLREFDGRPRKQDEHAPQDQSHASRMDGCQPHLLVHGVTSRLQALDSLRVYSTPNSTHVEELVRGRLARAAWSDSPANCYSIASTE